MSEKSLPSDSTQTGKKQITDAHGVLIAIVIRASYRPTSIEFLTPQDASQQLAIMRRPAGHKVRSHVHNRQERSISYTQEVLFVRSGAIEVALFGSDQLPLETCVLGTGDVILLAGGGHGVHFLEESDVIEVKQGPYLGDKDKRFL